MANVVSVNLEKDIEEQVKQYALNHGISKSQAINELLKQGLSQGFESSIKKQQEFVVIPANVLEEIVYSTFVLRKTLLYWILNQEITKDEWQKIKEYSRDQAIKLIENGTIPIESEDSKLSDKVYTRKH